MIIIIVLLALFLNEWELEILVFLGKFTWFDLIGDLEPISVWARYFVYKFNAFLPRNRGIPWHYPFSWLHFSFWLSLLFYTFFVFRFHECLCTNQIKCSCEVSSRVSHVLSFVNNWTWTLLHVCLLPPSKQDTF